MVVALTVQHSRWATESTISLGIVLNTHHSARHHQHHEIGEKPNNSVQANIGEALAIGDTEKSKGGGLEGDVVLRALTTTTQTGCKLTPTGIADVRRGGTQNVQVGQT